MAGLGLSYTDMPSQILIAENVDLSEQGRVYGAHFAWSHVWWATGYTLAGFTGSYFAYHDFLIGGLLSLFLLSALCIYEFRFQRT